MYRSFFFSIDNPILRLLFFKRIRAKIWVGRWLSPVSTEYEDNPTTVGSRLSFCPLAMPGGFSLTTFILLLFYFYFTLLFFYFTLLFNYGSKNRKGHILLFSLTIYNYYYLIYRFLLTNTKILLLLVLEHPEKVLLYYPINNP